MNILQIKCPSCGATLEAENNIDTFFCKYCGTKIIVADQNEETIKAKAKIKSEEQQIKHQEFKLQHESKERSKTFKRNLVIAAIVIVVLAAIIIALAISNHQYESKINAEVQRLETIMNEIQEDIDAGDYEAALSKTNLLHFTIPDEKFTEWQWDKIRKDTQKNIESLMKGN